MTSEVHPERKAAPGRLELVRAFVNTVDYFDEEEDLPTPEALRSWLAEHDLMEADEPVTEGDLRRALEVREGLRAILLSHNGESLDSTKVERLDSAARRAGMRVCFRPDADPELGPDAGGVDGALSVLFCIVAEAAADGTWERLKACPRDECFWAFYDRSKNRSKRWCRMEVCGNVEKARTYRDRRRREKRAQPATV